ncbi:MAG: helix-turn-helix transcriptional regulator [Armatimonadetes bacterium]|nr:helix-turn-helix transcriptional regulator [Armatimonadota bacterium]
MNSEMNVGAMLKSLSDPTRLHIVEFLAACQCRQAAIRDDGSVEAPTAGEVCCHVTGAEKISSTVSHHLHDLEAIGLVKLERRGKATCCTLNASPLVALADYFERLASGQGPANCCAPLQVQNKK